MNQLQLDALEPSVRLEPAEEIPAGFFRGVKFLHVVGFDLSHGAEAEHGGESRVAVDDPAIVCCKQVPGQILLKKAAIALFTLPQIRLGFVKIADIQKAFDQIPATVTLGFGNAFQNRKGCAVGPQKFSFGQIEHLTVIEHRAIADLPGTDQLVADLADDILFSPLKKGRSGGIDIHHTTRLGIDHHDAAIDGIQDFVQITLVFPQSGFGRPQVGQCLDNCAALPFAVDPACVVILP